MSSSPGWDNPPPHVDRSASLVDGTGEPVGLYLDDLPVYEQPPVPGAAYAVPAVSSRQAVSGFVLGLVGLVAVAVVSVFAIPLPLIGLFVSLDALRSCRHGQARGRRFALAGIILGAADILVALVAVLLGFPSVS